jgi:hypothetical protein
MRKILLTAIASVLIEATIANPIDTIDYWHVYYNNTMIGDFTQLSSSRKVNLNEKNIKPGDSIIVKYFRDTPCFDCSTLLVVGDESKRSVLTKCGKGTLTPLSVHLAELLEFKKRNKNNSFFEIFYFEEGRAEKMLLLIVKIE